MNNENTPLLISIEKEIELSKVDVIHEAKDIDTPQLKKSKSKGFVIFIIFSILLTLYFLNSQANNSNKFEIKKNLNAASESFFVVDENNLVLVEGKFTANFNNNGFSHLDISTHNLNIQSDQNFDSYFSSMEAMGYLEGYLTCNEISNLYLNFYSNNFGSGEPTKELVDFIFSNFQWMEQESEANWKESEYWLSVKTFLLQLKGMLNGFKEGCSSMLVENSESNGYLNNILKNPSILHLLFLNADGDIETLVTKFIQPSAGARRNLRDNEKNEQNLFHHDKNWKRIGRNHCSALIKLLPDYGDIYFGHNTWDDYQMGLGPRIMKHYRYPAVKYMEKDDNYDDGETKPFESRVVVVMHDVYFSSSAAMLTSVDDFYVVSGFGNMAVMETSEDIYNATLLNMLKPETMLSWTRAIIANRLADTGSSWAELFSLQRSGTYTNMWMVLDFARFTAGQAPSPEGGLLTVLEEVPGYIHYKDLTAHLLELGYFASYNNPFFRDIQQLTGSAELCKEDPLQCFKTDPRAMIFRSIQADVVDLPSMQRVMLYNRFRQDPLSRNDSCQTIACRKDLQLDVKQQEAFGAVDAKVSSILRSSLLHSAERLDPEIFAILGPSRQDQPAFCWDDFERRLDANGVAHKKVHVGQPNCFEFDWQLFPAVPQYRQRKPILIGPLV